MNAPENLERCDPLIDEVRENRRALAAEFGNDIDHLAKHLQEVQAQYESRTGPFVGVPRSVNDELFPHANGRISNPIINEIRQTRAAIAHGRTAGSK